MVGAAVVSAVAVAAAVAVAVAAVDVAVGGRAGIRQARGRRLGSGKALGVRGCGSGRHDRVLPDAAAALLGRARGRARHRHGASAAPVALLDDVRLERQRANDAVQLEKQSAGIAQRVALGIPPPQRRRLGEAVGAGGGHAPVVAASGAAAAHATTTTTTGLGAIGRCRSGGLGGAEAVIWGGVGTGMDALI